MMPVTSELRQTCVDETQPLEGVDTHPAVPAQEPTPGPEDGDAATESSADGKLIGAGDIDGPARDIPSPVSANDDTNEADQRLPQSTLSPSIAPATQAGWPVGLLGSPFPKTRFLPNST